MKIFRAKSLAALGLLIFVGQSSATDEANCKSIDNVLERLACYDESHKEQAEDPSPEDRRGYSSKTDGLKNIFADRDSRVVTTTLAEINKLPRSGAILYLANNQIWQFIKNLLRINYELLILVILREAINSPSSIYEKVKITK